MMSTSLMVSAFSPYATITNTTPKNFFSLNNLNPDEKPVKDDGKKKVVKRDDTTKTAINPLILAISSDEHNHEDGEEEVDS